MSHGLSFRRPFEKFLAMQGLHCDYSTDDEVMRDLRSVELADAPEIDVYTDYDTITQAIDVSEAVRKQQLETPSHSPPPSVVARPSYLLGSSLSIGEYGPHRCSPESVIGSAEGAKGAKTTLAPGTAPAPQ